jgi:hypothetical protein
MSFKLLIAFMTVHGLTNAWAQANPRGRARSMNLNGD